MTIPETITANPLDNVQNTMGVSLEDKIPTIRRGAGDDGDDDLESQTGVVSSNNNIIDASQAMEEFEHRQQRRGAAKIKHQRPKQEVDDPAVIAYMVEDSESTVDNTESASPVLCITEDDPHRDDGIRRCLRCDLSSQEWCALGCVFIMIILVVCIVAFYISAADSDYNEY